MEESEDVASGKLNLYHSTKGGQYQLFKYHSRAETNTCARNRGSLGQYLQEWVRIKWQVLRL